MVTSNFIGYKRSSNGQNSFQAESPETGEKLTEKFYWATAGELQESVALSALAFELYKEVSMLSRARFLEAIAEELNTDAAAIIERVSLETGYPIGRARAEFVRTCNQVTLFAKLLREGSWVDARIDTADTKREPSPKPDIRRSLVPLGPVVVFGASNFPLAFSTIGGDTVSALAAGCPVIIKAHPLHPGTNSLVSLAIVRAALHQSMPEGVFSSLHLTNEMAMQLVMHPQIKAVGFTGSRPTGLRLMEATIKRDYPIPVYAEMSSINPVVVLPGAIKTNGNAIAAGLADAISLGAGQFCTNPGLLILMNTEDTKHFIRRLANSANEKAPQLMLGKAILENYFEKLTYLLSFDGVSHLNDQTTDGEEAKINNKVKPTLLEVTGSAFLSNKLLQDEVFGPATLIVRCYGTDELIAVLEYLQGQLTATLHASPLDDIFMQQKIVSILRNKVGRIIFNGYPTGVEVCDAMQHGGPYPSTSDVRFTSVGTAAIVRFVRPLAFQDFPDSLLPLALQNANPENILRKVNGQLTSEKL